MCLPWPEEKYSVARSTREWGHNFNFRECFDHQGRIRDLMTGKSCRQVAGGLLDIHEAEIDLISPSPF